MKESDQKIQKRWKILLIVIAAAVILGAVFFVIKRGSAYGASNRYITISRYDKIEISRDVAGASSVSKLTDDQFSSLETAAWNKVLENTTVKKLPEDRVSTMEKKIKKTYTDMAEQMGVSLDAFLKDQFNGKTEKKLDGEIKDQAKAAVKEELMIELIEDREHIKLSDVEYEKAKEAYAKSIGLEDTDTLDSIMDKEELHSLIMQNSVKEWVAKHVVITAGSSSEGMVTEGSSEMEVSGNS